MGASSSSPRFLRPPSLADGDLVSLVAPAGKYPLAARDEGCRWLSAQGVRVESERTAPPHFAFAGPLEGRVEALQQALSSDSSCLWAVRGGSGAGRVVTRVEPAIERELSRSPRWWVGFSDNTAVHARVQAAGLMSLHAANVCTLSSWSEAARLELWQCLDGSRGRQTFAGEPVASSEGTPPFACGPLVGGNLTVLASLVGCHVLPPWQGCIVLFEDVDERPYRLARALGQLIDGGALDGISAVAFGQMTRCEDGSAGYEARAFVLDTLAPLQVPVVWGLPIGHEESSRPVVLGGQAHLDAAAGTLEVTF